ncbi:MAG: glycerophosphodiester phosphodiesterase [Lachnospiraceae bacterium]|nr:glycerophosphodiester phosphodiesterase [Lachnospiraceae bacterium]
MKNNRKHLPKIIAHRGASALAEHENTLESFEIAIDLECDMAEFDIRKTKDGKLIVFHDSCIYKEEHMRFVPKPLTTFTKSKRYYKAKKSPYKGKKIDKLTYEQINKIAGKQGYRVPLLDEVLTLLKGKIFLDVEIKESGFEDEVIDAIVNRFGYGYDAFSIKSFKDAVSKRVKKIDPNITTGLLVGRSVLTVGERLSEYFPEARLKKCKADFISPNYVYCNPFFLTRMRLEGRKVYPWTVNNRRIAQYLALFNVEGIITDQPDIVSRKMLAK